MDRGRGVAEGTGWTWLSSAAPLRKAFFFFFFFSPSANGAAVCLEKEGCGYGIRGVMWAARVAGAT